MPMMLVMFAAATVPQPSGATLSRSPPESLVPVVAPIFAAAAAAKVARLKVGRRARHRRLDRVVRIVSGRAAGALDRVALQDEAKVIPLVVQTGQLLVKVVRQRQAKRHLEPAAAGRTLGGGRRRNDRQGRRRRQTVQLPVGFTTSCTDLAVPVP